MTNKLVINSLKINSVNGQTLPLKDFSDGFNVVCGANEAGKSTMMKFLKDALFAPKDLTGDIELTKSGTKYQIKVEGKKSKNARLKVLAPENKSIEEVLEGFDQNFYQRAFTINLGDINNIDSELFSLIQDHNAPVLAEYKSRLEEELKEYLTGAGKPNKKLCGIVTDIADIEAKIRDLSGKEEEYAKVTSAINTVFAAIENTQKLIDDKEKFIAGQALKEQMSELLNETETLKKSFNRKLFDNKQIFYDIATRAALISGYLEEINNIVLSQIPRQIDESITGIKLRYNIAVMPEQVENIDVSREREEQVRNYLEEINNKKNMLSNLDDKIQDISKNLQELEIEINNLKSKCEILHITDGEKYERALNELKAGVTSLADLSDNTGGKKNLLSAIFNLIIAVFLIGLGVYILLRYGWAGLPVIVSGVILCVPGISSLFLSGGNDKAKEIYGYLKNRVMPVLDRDEFLETVSSLNQIVFETESRLNEYKSLVADINNKKQKVADYEAERAITEEKKAAASKNIDENTTVLNALTTIDGKILPAKNFLDMLAEIRSVRELIAQANSGNSRKLELEKECDNYFQNFVNFLTAAELDNTINPSALGAKISEVQSLIEENDKYKNKIDDNILRISDLEQKISQIPLKDTSPDRTLEELVAVKEELIREHAGLLQEKRGLEEFEGIVGLRNEKNLMQNRLNDIISDLYSKKLALNIIDYAEKKQRSIEPNLMSAEKLLREITGGKYINANFAGKTITSKDGEIKQDAELSRGTREQLYLAFRLGYALNYGSDGSKYRLPLIIDDAFVNFDRERLCAVLNALKEFAKTNQVLFFTCHRDYILSLVKEINAEINIIDI